MKKFTFFSILASSVWMISCQSEEDVFGDDLANMEKHEVVYLNLDLEPVSIDMVNPTARTQNDSPYSVIMHSAEYITAPESAQMGKTVIFSDRGNKQLDFDFSPFASLDGSSDISYYVDQMRPASTLPLLQTEAAIESAVNTWDNARCSDIGLNRVTDIPVPIGIVASILGFPSTEGYVADVNHCGWMPGSFFDFLAPGGSDFILGVTFTLLLIDENGDYIDTNDDGKFDVGLREIYYNDDFSWSDGSGIDVETVALHEMGHGLSQAHFGKAFIKRNGQVQFAPRAVMNAAYSGVQTKVSGTDQGGHCSIWGNWPNN
ncbi:MAG: hypothetical protein WD426_06405 [Anditalea sp.]